MKYQKLLEILFKLYAVWLLAEAIGYVGFAISVAYRFYFPTVAVPQVGSLLLQMALILVWSILLFTNARFISTIFFPNSSGDSIITSLTNSYSGLIRVGAGLFAVALIVWGSQDLCTAMNIVLGLYSITYISFWYYIVMALTKLIPSLFILGLSHTKWFEIF